MLLVLLDVKREDETEPHDPRNDGKQHDDGHKDGADLVGEALDGCSRVLSVLNELHDLIEGGVLGNFLNLQDDRALDENSAAVNLHANLLLHWL